MPNVRSLRCARSKAAPQRLLIALLMAMLYDSAKRDTWSSARAHGSSASSRSVNSLTIRLRSAALVACASCAKSSPIRALSAQFLVGFTCVRMTLTACGPARAARAEAAA